MYLTCDSCAMLCMCMQRIVLIVFSDMFVYVHVRAACWYLFTNRISSRHMTGKICGSNKGTKIWANVCGSGRL